MQGAALAPITTSVWSSAHLRRLLVVLVAIALAITVIAIEAPIAAQGRSSNADRIVHYARSHLGARFRIGTTGMRYFDCSGLVFRVYQQAGLLKKIGGTRKRAAAYFSWFRKRGLVSRANPKVGDLIWWTKRGRIVHIGLYIGGNQAISALINPYGVRKHSVRGIHVKFLGFGHAGINR